MGIIKNLIEEYSNYGATFDSEGNVVSSGQNLLEGLEEFDAKRLAYDYFVLEAIVNEKTKSFELSPNLQEGKFFGYTFTFFTFAYWRRLYFAVFRDLDLSSDKKKLDWEGIVNDVFVIKNIYDNGGWEDEQKLLQKILEDKVNHYKEIFS